MTWHTLAERGITIRGEPRERLQIHTDVEELRRWSLGNLNGYWRRWARRRLDLQAPPRRTAAFGALGAPRLHCTVATGAIITKEAAAEYALQTFGHEWHPLIGGALAFRRGVPMPTEYAHRPLRLRRDASRFVAAVIETANRLPI